LANNRRTRVALPRVLPPNEAPEIGRHFFFPCFPVVIGLVSAWRKTLPFFATIYIGLAVAARKTLPFFVLPNGVLFYGHAGLRSPNQIDFYYLARLVVSARLLRTSSRAAPSAEQFRIRTSLAMTRYRGEPQVHLQRQPIAPWTMCFPRHAVVTDTVVAKIDRLADFTDQQLQQHHRQGTKKKDTHKR
jgi:hypothetical protein